MAALRVLRRVLPIVAGTLSVLIAASACVVVWLGTPSGSDAMGRGILALLEQAGLRAEAEGVVCDFPSGVRAARLRLLDGRGPFLTIRGGSLAMDWAALADGVVRVARVAADAVDVARVPDIAPSSSEEAPSGGSVLPALPAIELGRLEIGAFSVSSPFAGRPDVTGSGLSLAASLRDGVLRVGDLSVGVAGLRILGSAVVRPTAGGLPLCEGRLSVGLADAGVFSAFAGLPETMRAERVSVDVEAGPDGSGAQRLGAKWDVKGFGLAGLGLVLSEGEGTLEASMPEGRPCAALSARLGKGVLGGLGWDGGRIGLSWKAGEGAGSFGVGSLSCRMEGDARLHAVCRAEGSALFIDAFDAGVASKGLGLTLEHPVRLDRSGDGIALTGTAAFRTLPEGRVRIGGRVGPENAVRLDLDAPMAGIAGLAGLPLQEGRLTGDVRLEGAAAAPKASARLSFREASVAGVVPLAADAVLSLPAGGRALEASLRVGVPGAGSLEGGVALPMRYGGSVPVPDERAALSGSLGWKGSVGTLWRLVPMVGRRLEGRADVSVTLGGTVASPTLSGRATLRDGVWTDVPLGMELNRLSADADLSGDGRVGLRLTGGSAAGSFSLSGSADLSGDGIPLHAKASLSGLSPLRRPDVQGAVSGEVVLSGTAADPLLTGTLTVDALDADLGRLPGGSVSTLDVIDMERPEAAASEAVRPGTYGRADLAVRLQGRCRVRGFGADTEWTGAVRVLGALDAPAVTGEIRSVKGTMTLLGKLFTLERGRVSLGGGTPPDPGLDIDMRYESASIEAHALLGGTAGRPVLTLVSRPSMPREEIVSRILFGRASDGISRSEALQLAVAAANLSDPTGGVTDVVRKAARLDVLRMGKASTHAPRTVGNPLSADAQGGDEEAASVLELGKQVLDNVYLGIYQPLGDDADTEVFVDVEVLPGRHVKVGQSVKRTTIGFDWSKDY